ncbi:MAG: DUF7284 family protein, partial [Methanosarcinaceae archaeon]
FLSGQTAFSSTVDALFFLLMVSVAAVVLMPYTIADKQYEAAEYSATQEFDTHLLKSLLKIRANEFEYQIEPLALVNISMPSVTMQNSVKALFGKEQGHRTFADFLAESMALNLMMDNNGSKVYLNPMAEEHSIATEEMIRSYLDSKIGERYNYRFEAHWYPVSGFSLGSDIVIGNEPPPDSIRQNTIITLPFTITQANDVFEAVSDPVLSDALGSSSNEIMCTKLHDGFNDSIDAAARGAAVMIVRSTFPSSHMVSINRTKYNTGIVLDPDLVITACFLDYTANTIADMDVEIPEDIILTDLVSLVEEGLVFAMQEQIAFRLKTDMSGEINNTVSGIIDSSDIGDAKVLRDIQVESIHRRVDCSGVNVELMIWQ